VVGPWGGELGGEGCWEGGGVLSEGEIILGLVAEIFCSSWQSKWNVLNHFFF
jgi:hypothetical protein